MGTSGFTLFVRNGAGNADRHLYRQEGPSVCRVLIQFFIVIEDRKLVFLQYFVTIPEVHTADLQQQALQGLTEMYRDRPVIVVYESVCPECDDAAERERRRAFYLHNGFHECPWYALYEHAKYGIASSTETVSDTVIEHLLHLYQSFNSNFYTHHN